MGRDMDYESDFDEMDLSALKEIGNIIAASYLNALSTMTNLVITPSIPHIAVDMAASILSVRVISHLCAVRQHIMHQTAYFCNWVIKSQTYAGTKPYRCYNIRRLTYIQICHSNFYNFAHFSSPYFRTFCAQRDALRTFLY